MNGASYDVAHDRIGLLNVFNANVEDCGLEQDYYDAFILDDVLEHVYHPYSVLETAYASLRKGGIAYLETFIIDCQLFEEKKGDWDFLFWNHVNHFSSSTLQQIFKNVGFKQILVMPTTAQHIMCVAARK